MDKPQRKKKQTAAEKRPLRFSDGSHMVGLYTVEDNILQVLIPFFAEGLRQGEKCFYAAPPATIARVKKSLKDKGVDVDAVMETGQLALLDDKDPLLKAGRFNPEHLVDLYRTDVDQSLAAGWKHVRATAEMSWLIEGVAGRDGILYYEALSTRLFNNTDRVHALCQYNTSRMSGAEIIELLKIHPWALIDGKIGENPYWIDPDPEIYAPGKTGSSAAL